MLMIFRRLALAAAMALGLLAHGAHAQNVDSPRLALSIAHDMFDAMDARAMIMKGARGATTSFGEMGRLRPDWPKFAMDALEEEVGASMPAIEGVVARRMVAAFTPDELMAGQIMMSDPTVKAVFAAGAQGRPAPTATGCSRECMRAIQSPAGKSFMNKLSDKDQLFGEQAQAEILGAIMPGFLRRFADRIEASEKASTSH